MISYRMISKDKRKTPIEKYRKVSRFKRKKSMFFFSKEGDRYRMVFIDFNIKNKFKTGLATDEQKPCLGL
jgi:hypothetical protein